MALFCQALLPKQVDTTLSRRESRTSFRTSFRRDFSRGSRSPRGSKSSKSSKSCKSVLPNCRDEGDASCEACSQPTTQQAAYSARACAVVAGGSASAADSKLTADAVPATGSATPPKQQLSQKATARDAAKANARAKLTAKKRLGHVGVVNVPTSRKVKAPVDEAPIDVIVEQGDELTRGQSCGGLADGQDTIAKRRSRLRLGLFTRPISADKKTSHVRLTSGMRIIELERSSPVKDDDVSSDASDEKRVRDEVATLAAVRRSRAEAMERRATMTTQACSGHGGERPIWRSHKWDPKTRQWSPRDGAGGV